MDLSWDCVENLAKEKGAGLLGRLELDDRSTPPFVGRQHLVDDGSREAAALLGGADTVGVVAEGAGIDHRPMLPSG